MAFGAGVGVGMGFSNCQHDFMYPDLHHGQLKKVILDYFSHGCLILNSITVHNNETVKTFHDDLVGVGPV